MMRMPNIELVIALVILSFLVYVALRTPSHEGNWSEDQSVLPSVSTYGDFITVHNVRQARYKSVDDYEITHTDTTFRLNDIKKAWLAIEPFGSLSLFGLKAAHVLISFQLHNGTYISISPEIRKKRDKKFAPVRALFRWYEIMYVVADEKDVIELRTTCRKDTVLLYPLKLNTNVVQNLFTDMAAKINQIHSKALFYNTALHSCTTNIAQHLRNVSIPMPRYHPLYLLPKTLDSVFYKRGLIDTDLSLDEARKYFDITKRAQSCCLHADFSQCIRLM